MNDKLYIDTSKLPETDRDAWLHVAETHGALVDSHLRVKLDIDGISGSSQEEKAETHEFMGRLRPIVHWLHTKRFNVALITFQTWLLIKILEAFGVDTKTISPYIQHITTLLLGT